jgi:2-octaprenylphenol hydroxylase
VSSVEHEILIIGGGPVGLNLAALLQRCDNYSANDIALVESTEWAAHEPAGPLGIRVSALSPVSRTLLEMTNAWQAIHRDRVCPIERMVIWEGDDRPDPARQLEFSAAETGVPALGYIVENDSLTFALRRSLEAGPEIAAYTGAKPVNLGFGGEGAQVSLDSGVEVTARLVVGADGANSWVRRSVGVGLREHDYDQVAIVGHLETDRAHGNTAWQRFMPGGPLALLPLPDGRVSIVWSRPSARAAEILALDAREFEQLLYEASAGVLGRFSLSSEAAGFPLRRCHAERYTGRRWALAGDAAHRVHPLAGQGLNLGLLDCASLVSALREGAARHLADPGDPVVLRHYERSRKGETVAMLAVTDTLNGLFSTDSVLSRLAGDGLAAVNALGPVKQLLTRHAMGIGSMIGETEIRQ